MSQDNFKEKIKSQLDFLGSIKSKNMFGTSAFSKEGIFFASIEKKKLYFKVDENTVQDFEKYGMPSLNKHRKSLDYYQVPDEIITNQKLFQDWATKALKSAINKKK